MRKWWGVGSGAFSKGGACGVRAEPSTHLSGLGREPAEVQRRSTSHPGALLYSVVTASIGLLIAVGWLAFHRLSTSNSPTPPEQITAFSENVTQPSLSADGRMVTFIGGGSDFVGSGQIFVKLLPNGDSVQLTHDSYPKATPAFSPDGNRIAYTVLTENMSWDTWTVPVLGGEPHLWLPNASGLTWTGPGRVLFSEIKSGIHMAIVSATESRTESHDIYVPPDIRGMAHRSYMSPDGKSVLISEMDRTGTLPCKLVDTAGKVQPRIVGPATGHCLAAAWSPDGVWMYFNSTAKGGLQLWRQQTPDGSPEMITSGTTSVSGIAPLPDGHAVISSVGIVQSSVWVHDQQGDRRVSGEGNAHLPAWGDGMPGSVFSHDGSKLYYLVRTGGERGFGGGELWVADLAGGHTEKLFPGVIVSSYDVSPDDQNITYSSIGSDGIAHAWIARLDRRSPPRQLQAGEALGPVFGQGGFIYYRAGENGNYFIFEQNPKTGAIRKVTPEQAINSPSITPDGRWLVSTTPVPGDDAATVRLYPVAGGSPVDFCPRCFPKWTSDGRDMFLSLLPDNGMGIGSTYVIDLPAGRDWPVLPPEGIRSAANLKELPMRKTIDKMGLFPGRTADVYAYVKTNAQQNLYKLQLPR
jgi:eukaryotic-like serine/threonine-protein kinase